MNRRFLAMVAPALMASVLLSVPAFAKSAPVAKVSAVSVKHAGHKPAKPAKKKAFKGHSKRHHKALPVSEK